jgi:hypothetical protein
MKLEVSFWKNWDCTFGARIRAVELNNQAQDFPTLYIFTDDVVDNVNEFEKDGASSLSAKIDFAQFPVVEDWVEKTIYDVKALVNDWRNRIVPDGYVVEI